MQTAASSGRPRLIENNPVPVAVHGDWSGLVSEATPLRRGSLFHVYARELGPVIPPQQTGEPSGVATLLNSVQCSVPVLYQGLAPGEIGLYLLTLQVPEDYSLPYFFFNCGQRTPNEMSASLPYTP